MTTLTVKVDVDPDEDRIAVWKSGIGWVEMDRGWFANVMALADRAVMARACAEAAEAEASRLQAEIERLRKAYNVSAE